MVRWKRLAQLLLFAALLGNKVEAQKPAKDQQPAQSNFGSDEVPGEASIKRPVEISPSALQVLRNTDNVAQCLKDERIKPERVPASWFVGSEIHLNGARETDLIVLPNVPKIVAHQFPPDLNGGCLLGAHTGPFWVLRNTGQKYELLLETNADALEVLDSRTKGYRDIREQTGFADATISITFRFDGEKYQLSKRQETPVAENH